MGKELTKPQNSEELRGDEYEVGEAVELILDGIAFPFYIAKVGIVPVLIVFVVLVVIGYFFTANIFTMILFVLLSYVISLPVIVLSTVVLLFTSIRNDLKTIFRITLETVAKVRNDSNQAHLEFKEGKKKASFTEAFSTVMNAAIIPGLKHGIQYRIPFLGHLITGIISSVMKKVIKKDEESINKTMDGVENGVESLGEGVAKVHKGSIKSINVIFGSLAVTVGVISLPVLIVVSLIVWGLAFLF